MKSLILKPLISLFTKIFPGIWWVHLIFVGAKSDLDVLADFLICIDFVFFGEEVLWCTHFPHFTHVGKIISYDL